MYPTPLARYVIDMSAYPLGLLNVVAELLKRYICLRNIGFSSSVSPILDRASSMMLAWKLREQYLVGFSNRDGVVFSYIYPSAQRLVHGYRPETSLLCTDVAAETRENAFDTSVESGTLQKRDRS